MKLSKTSGTVLAATAAAMLLGGIVTIAPVKADDAKAGMCVGANACKGQSACKTASSSCKGLNSCKGQGFLELTKAECDKVGGKFEEKAS